MSIRCNQCGYELHPSDPYCSVCGTPSGATVRADARKPEIPGAIHCPTCGEKNVLDALHCAECSQHIYRFPEGQFLYCPRPGCGKKNHPTAKICSQCGLSFTDWRSMRGLVADMIGWQGSVRLHETMNEISYVILPRKQVQIGRDARHGILIPCQWVSAQHCYVDLDKGELVDTDSTNGTFVNQKDTQIGRMPLTQVLEFNVGGFFTFHVTRCGRVFAIRLSSIIDEPNCAQHGDPFAFEELRRTYFILSMGDGEVNVRKYDGLAQAKPKGGEKYSRLSIESGYYYFSDPSTGFEDQLIMKKHNPLPRNWKIELVQNE